MPELLDGAKHDEAGGWPKRRLCRVNTQGPLTSIHGQLQTDVTKFRAFSDVQGPPRQVVSAGEASEGRLLSYW